MPVTARRSWGAEVPECPGLPDFPDAQVGCIARLCDMATGTTPPDDAEQQPAETAKQEPGQDLELPSWGSLSADMRLLVVTFAGTLAANVVTVMVVGVALILVKNSKGYPRQRLR